MESIKRAIPARVSEGLRSCLRTIRNHLAGRAYYCKALQGESDYNICINSDLTVSCNCRDYDGCGHIGDLRHETLEEIFGGAPARKLRESLARGRTPLLQCKRCWELQLVSKDEAQQRLSTFHTPSYGIMVENTVQCNLRCLACDRRLVMATRSSTRMTLDDVEIVARTVQRCGIQEVAFHNLGEPFFHDSVLQELELIRRHNPGISMISSTNGVLLNTDSKRRAAMLLNRIYFSMDGPSQEIMVQYQRGGNFAAAYENLKALVAYRDGLNHQAPIIEWKYVVFAWNDAQEYIERAVELAREAGADVISFWPGGGEPHHVSSRFVREGYFRNLGQASWKGRELVLRPMKIENP